MNQFIELMAEEVLNEAFDIKKIANSFFKKHPDLLNQVSQLCKTKKNIDSVKIDEKDYQIIQTLWVQNNQQKATQLIKKLYKPSDSKYKYWMNIDELSEAKKTRKFLLSIAMALALGAGLLTGCNMPIGYDHVDYTENSSSLNSIMSAIMYTHYYTGFQILFEGYTDQTPFKGIYIQIIKLLIKKSDNTYETNGYAIITGDPEHLDSGWGILGMYGKQDIPENIQKFIN